MSKYYLKCCNLAIFMLLCVSIAFAQQSVTGIVSDASRPLKGVSVSIKGENAATQTDQTGAYSISAAPGQILRFAMVGYVTKEITVTSAKIINLSLEVQEGAIDEVVVTALGIKRQKKALGYSTQEVKGADLTIAQAPTIAQGLMGKVAGIQVGQSGGGVEGSSSRIVVRGNTSITGDNRALIIVDGVAINNDPVNVNGNSGNSVGGGQGADISTNNDWGTGMNFINQEDIEDITVLKGPAAAALYGARGGNGVILITRKKGAARSGLGVDYNYSYRSTQPFSFLDFQNEYGQGAVASMTGTDQSKWFPRDGNGTRYQIANGDNAPGNYTTGSFGLLPYPNSKSIYDYISYPGMQSWGPRFDDQPILNYDGVMRPYSAQPDNWKAFFPNGHVTSHNVALSGGNENATGRVSYTRNDTKANQLNSNFSSNVFTIGSSLKVSKKLTAEVTGSYINYSRLNAASIGQGYMGGVVYSMARDYNPEVDRMNNYGLNGSMIDLTVQSNFPANAPRYPYNSGYIANQFWIADNRNTELDRNQLMGGIKLNAELTDYLSIVAQGGVDNSNDVTAITHYPTDIFGRLNGAYKEALSRSLNTNLQAFARLHKDGIFGGDFNGSISVGGERYYRNDYTQSNSTAGNLVKPFIFALDNGADPVPQPYDLRFAKQINSVFGLLNLSYKDYLFLEATARNDWSSTLLKKYNSYFYPAVNGSFVFTEAFKGIQDNLSWLNFGKLKLSYAETGTDTNPYEVYNTLEIVNNNGNPAQSLQSTLKSQEVFPQRSRSFEGGVTLGLFNNRLNIDLTAYSMRTYNQILDNPVAYSTGVENVKINTGSLGNTGFEFMISGSPVKSENFSWDISVNGAHARTKVLALADGVQELTLGSFFGGSGISQRVKVGEYYGTLYGKDYELHNGQRIVRRAVGTDGQPLKFSANGQEYYAGTQWELTDGEVPIGNAQTFLTGGLSNTFRYKNWSLYVLTDAKIGGDTYFGSYAAAMGSGNLKETLKERNGGGLPLVYPDGSQANTGVNFGGVFVERDNDGNIISSTPNNDVVHYLWYYQGTYSAWNHLGVPRSAAVFKNSWMKLREVSLTYRLPNEFVQRSKFMQNLSISVIGRDLFYIFTTIPKGLNPEGVNSIGNMQGIEYGAPPRTRSFGLTLRTSF